MLHLYGNDDFKLKCISFVTTYDIIKLFGGIRLIDIGKLLICRLCDKCNENCFANVIKAMPYKELSI